MGVYAKLYKNAHNGVPDHVAAECGTKIAENPFVLITTSCLSGTPRQHPLNSPALTGQPVDENGLRICTVSCK